MTYNLEAGIAALIEACDPDPHRPGMADTPKRVVKAFAQMTEGYNQDPAEILSTRFELDADEESEIVMVTGIPFSSLCEHHLLPFQGTVDIGYLPVDEVVGLSKLPRLVNCFARRFQIQEQMTNQIAEAIQDNMRPAGVAVVVSGHHSCMSLRGVRSSGTMITSAMLGKFRTVPEARAEFMTARLGHG